MYFLFCFLLPTIDLVLANSADPDEMPHDVAFHLGLHCLPKFPVYKRIKKVLQKYKSSLSYQLDHLFFQLNMVCDGAVLKANGQMMFFGGLLTGSLLTGMISDRSLNIEQLVFI